MTIQPYKNDHDSINEPLVLVIPAEEEEFLGNDMCKEPAINWGKGRKNDLK